MRLVGSAVFAALWLLSPTAYAGPSIDEDIELLRARPTGMDEAEWRKKRREVAAELGESRSKKSVDALIEIVETERFDAVLSIAIQGLAKQGDPRAIPALQSVYRDRSLDTFIREEAAKAIIALGGRPQEDARLVGGTAGPTGGGTVALEGPQLGTMGAASVADDDEIVSLEEDKKLPENLRARDWQLAFVLGSLDLSVNTLVTQQPLMADAGVGALAAYVDERHRWGWTARGNLGVRIRNGDNTSTPSAAGGDDGDVLFIHQDLRGVGEAHVYFGKTDVHAFAEVGLSQRVTHLGIEDIEGGSNEETLTDTRFAMDVIPAAGLGWGRFLNAGGDLMVDAIVAALEAENILAKPLDDAARAAIQDAVFRRSNSWSAYPRLAATLSVLETGGFLARPPGPRLVHRLRSILEDPSYAERMRGIRVRAGFLYGAPIAQNDFFRRGGDAVGAPFVQFDAGFQLDLERQVTADARFWYDVIGDQGFTSDAGATYTRFLHTRYDDYAGKWFAGVRGGASRRTYPDLPDDLDIGLGFRAIGLAGYAYGFRRGSEIAVAANAGVDSGAFIAGAGLAFRLGIGRGSVLRAPADRSATRSRRSKPAKRASTGAAETSGEHRSGAPAAGDQP